jgi:hypothetical protein
MWIGQEVLMIEEVQVDQPSTWVIFGIMVEKETVFSIVFHNIRKVYFKINMLYTGSIDEEKISGHTGGILRAYYDSY